MESRIEMLEMEGFSVITLNNVDDALEELEKDPLECNLLLLDVMMPKGDAFKDNDDAADGFRTGLVFLAELEKRGIDIPVIVITANPDREVELKCQANKLVEYFLGKPVNQDELEEVIKRILFQGKIN